MHLFFVHLLVGYGISLATVLGLALALTLWGRHIGRGVTHAPGLDGVVSLLTWVPWVIGGVWGGWPGWLGVLIGQVTALVVWCRVHETMHPQAMKGPRIVSFLNRTVGRWQNHLALWFTVIALPVFLLIRALQLGVYWVLPLLLGFPRYSQSEWVNVSRQKFEGLVGHDLIWCLYCDWMTGVYSLGAEMLRNVESFWCPIRFYDGKKCENCRIDFPDIENGWVKETGNMSDVVKLMEEKYTHGQRSWFGHPVRLTIKGKPIE
ncbi:MAG: hypothetical protein KatS3mg104_1302 [Phycisphaerae bacterium]|jgi:hypothetical protein|nr:MAG: hypothetical protein KatS3mg104_1302 [Phycisphaerae bacterium]